MYYSSQKLTEENILKQEQNKNLQLKIQTVSQGSQAKPKFRKSKTSISLR